MAGMIALAFAGLAVAGAASHMRLVHEIRQNSSLAVLDFSETGPRAVIVAELSAAGGRAVSIGIEAVFVAAAFGVAVIGGAVEGKAAAAAAVTWAAASILFGVAAPFAAVSAWSELRGAARPTAKQE